MRTVLFATCFQVMLAVLIFTLMFAFTGAARDFQLVSFAVSMMGVALPFFVFNLIGLGLLHVCLSQVKIFSERVVYAASAAYGILVAFLMLGAGGITQPFYGLEISRWGVVGMQVLLWPVMGIILSFFYLRQNRMST